MSGRRLTSDSGEPDLWSNGSVFMGPREPISIDPSPHIPLQQTTANEPAPKGHEAGRVGQGRPQARGDQSWQAIRPPTRSHERGGDLRGAPGSGNAPARRGARGSGT